MEAHVNASDELNENVNDNAETYAGEKLAKKQNIESNDFHSQNSGLDNGQNALCDRPFTGVAESDWTQPFNSNPNWLKQMIKLPTEKDYETTESYKHKNEVQIPMNIEETNN